MCSLKMEPVGITAQKLIRNWSCAKQKEDILKDGLRELFTIKERRHIKRYALKEGRITLNVDSSAWLYLLNFKKRQLLKNINQILQPNEAITEIHLRLDRDEAKSQTKNQIKSQTKR